MKKYLNILYFIVLTIYSSIVLSMNKYEMIDAIASDTGLSKEDSNAALNSFIKIIQRRLAAGDQVTLSGFGTFMTSSKSAVIGRHPQTGEAIHIPARKSPGFRAGRDLKQAVNSGNIAAEEEARTNERQDSLPIKTQGVVKWFNESKGFGFISPDDGSNDIFVHFSEIRIQGYRTLKEGQKVKYEVASGAKGLHAVKVIPY